MEMKLWMIKQLHNWWFLICTLLTVELLKVGSIGNKLLPYLFFDAVLPVLGRHALSHIHTILQHKQDLDCMLPKNRNENIHLP